MLELIVASISDSEELNSLDKEIFNSHCYSNYLDILKDDKSLVCLGKENSEIVGYTYFKVTQDECELYHVGVAQKFRGLNIANRLLSYSSNILKERGVKKIFLEVRQNNKIAIKLYENYGFKRYNTRKNYYGNEIDAYCYVMEVR